MAISSTMGMLSSTIARRTPTVVRSRSSLPRRLSFTRFQVSLNVIALREKGCEGREGMMFSDHRSWIAACDPPPIVKTQPLTAVHATCCAGTFDRMARLLKFRPVAIVLLLLSPAIANAQNILQRTL